MSRIGRKPVDLPEKVKVSAEGRMVSVSGPLGNLDTLMPEGITLNISDKQVQVNAPAKKTRANAGFLGLGRALVANMVTGVTVGYEKNLLINGVGYRAELSG
jgi:large subunit ribosomal protein L6